MKQNKSNNVLHSHGDILYCVTPSLPHTRR